MLDKPETQSEVLPGDAQFWLAEIEAAKDRLADWYEKALEAEDRYKDCTSRSFGQLNIFWANVETQTAAIGEDFGKPQVTRVNQPENDGGLSRHVATIWERAIAAAVRDTNDNHDISLAVRDTFIPGRGQVWIEVEADEDENGQVNWGRAPIVRVPYLDYLEGFATRWSSVPWVARAHMFTRDELVAVCGLSEEEADDVPLSCQMNPDGSHKKRRKNKKEDQFSRARVWEIWTKYPAKMRIYVAEGYNDRTLCADPDPYGLKSFFPCPRSFLANGDEGWQEPLTDYSRYEDQAKELDQISSRIFVLTAALRRRGVRDKQFEEIADLAYADDNVFLPVENWAELLAKASSSGRAGLESVMMAEDLTGTITVLAQLHEQRRTLIDLIYELSGISDLARGMTDPRETLGAQQLKMSFGAGRFKHRESESRRFAAEAYQIKGEVVAEHFPRQQLAEMTGIPLPTQGEITEARKQLQQIQEIQQKAEAARQQLQQLASPPQPQQQPPQGQEQGAPPQQPQAPQQPPAPPPSPVQLMQLQAMAQTPPPDEEQMLHLQRIAGAKFSWERISAVLRSEYRRCYTVEVETDQTNFNDEEADKRSRIELVDMVNRLMTQFGPFIQGNPANGEMVKKLIMFAVSAFRAGRALEEDIEIAVDNAVQAAAQAPKQPEDPLAEKQGRMLDLQIAEKQFSLEGQKTKMQELQLKNKQIELDAAAERERLADDRNLERLKFEKEIAFKEKDTEMDQQRLAIEIARLELEQRNAALQEEKTRFDMAHTAETTQFDQAMTADKHEFDKTSTVQQQSIAADKHEFDKSNADRQHEMTAKKQEFDQSHASRVADDNATASGVKRKKSADGKETSVGAEDERYNEIADVLAQHLAKQSEIIAKVLSAPKRVVKGDGNNVTVETVMEAA
jgi:hypothetical protein